MSNGGALEPAGTDHVVNTVVGYTVGTIATGVALAVAGPLLAPVGVLVAATGLTLPFVGGAVGAWIGYNKAQAKALRYGVRKG